MRGTLISCLALATAGSALIVACSDDPGGSPFTPTTVDSGTKDAEESDASVIDASAPDALDPNDGFTAGELAAMKQLSPLPALAPDPTNAFADNAAAAVLGQRLFFDKTFSGALTVGSDGTNGGLGNAGEVGKVACVSCHASKGTDDDRTVPNNVSLGTDYGTRNALPIVNSSFYKWTNWGGRFDSQWSLPLAVAENAKLMKSSRLQIAHMLYDKYKTDYDAIFPVPLDPALSSTAADAARFPATGKPKAAADLDGAWEAMAPADQMIANRIFANFGKAIAAYVRLNVSRDAGFDKYVAGDKATMSADAKRGFKLFVGKGKCVECHSGPNFADDQFHNIGVEQTGVRVPGIDTGRLADITPLLASPFNTQGAYSDNTSTGMLSGLAAQEINRGQFRTKSLRGLGASGPYMHAGQLATLDAVVSFYSTGGANPADAGAKDSKITALGLTPGEASDLVAFLKALDGATLPPALLVDTSK